MNTFCNPLDLNYRYQHMQDQGRNYSYREAADPALVLFKGIYYLFASMSAGFWYSDDLLSWKFHENRSLLIYDYAPDVRQIGDALYFCASRRGENCPFLRSENPLADDFQQVSAPFAFWDPDMFQDDDGRVYFYWGCSNMDPIWGIEMDPETMLPLGEPVALMEGNESCLGYERAGENGVVRREGGIFDFIRQVSDPETGEVRLPENIPPVGGFTRDMLLRMIQATGRPYIEGAFMTKHQGRYYLQYACSGTQFNTYSDGVYVSDKPLGPFVLQSHNPYSSKPGGFIHGAGHGSAICDKYGNYWHASTLRISVNHIFERRLALSPAGFDADGILFCNQNFADYPMEIPSGKFDPWSVTPKWMLLSYNKPATASSSAPGSSPRLAVNEDARTWWSAAVPEPGQWLTVDLEKESDIRAIQVNLADEDLCLKFDSADYHYRANEGRFIEANQPLTHFTLEASLDGESWFTLKNVARDCANAYFVWEQGISARYIRVTGGSLPYDQPLRISGLRIFGNGNGEKPAQVQAKAVRNGELDCTVSWEKVPSADGYNVRYGIAPNKLYCSWMVYGADHVNISTLIKDRNYWFRVDSFNENGITEGPLITF